MATIIRNGEVIELTAEEEEAFEATRRPILSVAKKLKREAIRNRKEQAESTFPYGAARYDASAAGRIAVLANAARISGAGFPVRVAAIDESETNLSRAEYQAFEAALAAHLQDCSAHANTLRQTVGAATDVPAVLAIDIEAGWP